MSNTLDELRPTLDEILLQFIAEYHQGLNELNGRGTATEQAKAALRDLFYTEVLELIGADEAPDTEKRKGPIEKGGNWEYEPAYSLRATVVNQKLATLRAKAKAKWGKA